MATESGELEPLNLPDRPEFTHRAHRFPGKFHPPLIAQILKDHPEHNVIADPMCGSGTAGVEAAAAGRNAICNDIDPLSSLITRGKTHPVDPKELDSIGDQILDDVDTPEEGTISDDDAKEEVKANMEGTRYTVPINLLHWFEPYVAVGYSRLLLSAHDELETETPEMTDAIRTTLAAMVRKVSRADPQPVSGLEVTSVRKEELEEGIDFDIEGSFNRCLNKLVQGYDQLLEIDDLGDIEVWQANAKRFSELCEQSEYDPTMVITSPPYCNAIEYSRRHRLECEWLGLYNGDDVDDPRNNRLETSREFFGSRKILQDTLRNLDPVPNEDVQELTANIEEKGYERKANLLRKYFLDAYDWIDEVHKALPEDGLFCLIVGPSTSYGYTVDTPSYLEDIALEKGFEVESKQRYQLTNNKMQYPTDGPTTDMEALIKFRAI